MRVTNSMISNRVLYNMQRSLSRFMNLETEMSSGRRINKPSDDPGGTQRDLTYRTELAKIDQYQKNVTAGLNWMGTYDTILADVKNSVSTAKEVAVSMANGNYDNIARTASASEIRSIFEQMVQLANTELEGRSVFGGFRTQETPFVSSANGVVYSGDQGRMQYEIESSMKMAINLTGSEVFLAPLRALGEDADLNVALTGATLLSDLNAGEGVDLAAAPASITIADLNLGISSNIDLSGATTVQDVIDTINAQLTADGITNLTVGIGEEGNNLAFFPTQTGEITTVTRLDKLNNGQGIDFEPGQIHISDGAGIDVTVDLTEPITVGSVETIGDLITEFNDQLTAAGINNVTMAVNATGTGLMITDSNGVPLGLTVSDISANQSTAADLGIDGDVGVTLVGRDLEPVVYFDVAEAGGTTADDLGILGSFTSNRPGDDLDAVLTADSSISDFRNGLGTSDGSLILWHGDDSLTIDMSDPTIVTVQDFLDTVNNAHLNITARINASGRGIEILNDDPSRSLTIEEFGEDRAAKDLGLFGSSDVMGTMLVLANSLERDDQEGTGMLLGNLDDAIQHLLRFRGTVGSQAVRLETTASRLTDQNLNFTKLLSDVEDADITELVTQLATYETNYQASLMASAQIIQPTLMDFLK